MNTLRLLLSLRIMTNKKIKIKIRSETNLNYFRKWVLTFDNCQGTSEFKADSRPEEAENRGQLWALKISSSRKY